MAGRKLKVFQAQFGFYDTVVAAPSQAAALRAWGVRQDLFASGEAKLTTDASAIAAAIAHPETPLRRAVGSSAPFALEPTSLPDVPDAPRQAVAKPRGKTESPALVRPRADRAKLDRAETALTAIDEKRKLEETSLRREAEELEARRIAAQEAYVEARKAATGKVVAARTAYRQAGGVD